MSPVPINATAASLDLSPRVFNDITVDASPALAAETVIATLTLTGDIAVLAGVLLFGWAAYTAGTSAVSGQLRIRRATVAGSVRADSGAVTNVAAALYSTSIMGFDAGAVMPGQIYVLTLQMASGSAVTTVSAVNFTAIVV